MDGDDDEDRRVMRVGHGKECIFNVRRVSWRGAEGQFLQGNYIDIHHAIILNTCDG